MGSEQYFEMRFTDEFERTYQVNGIEYLVKYTSGRSQGDGNNNQGVFVIRNKCNISVFVTFKLYSISNGDCVQTRTAFLRSCEEKLQIYLDDHNCNYGPFVCSVRVVRFEKWKNLLDPAKKEPTKHVTTSNRPTTESRLGDLSLHMKRLLEQGVLSDVILGAGSEEFPVHKSILSVRSKVFFKMFQHPTKENNENRVTIADVSSEVLKEMLTFIYTGCVTIKDFQMALELYEAADKYDVEELRAVCSENLTHVDLDSVLDMLALADSHGDQNLKQTALDFISANYSQVKAQEKWQSLMKKKITFWPWKF